jgi:hypothetical protein
MSEILRLIEKHRANGLLLDANLLILLLVGRTNKKRVPECNRTRAYSIKEYELLEGVVGRFPVVITTPHILTEVDDLLPLRGKEKQRFQTLFKQWVERGTEYYDESRHLVTEANFGRLGLADAAIGVVSKKGMLVLTDDFPLYGILSRQGVDVINFNHIRTAVW